MFDLGDRTIFQVVLDLNIEYCF